MKVSEVYGVRTRKQFLNAKKASDADLWEKELTIDNIQIAELRGRKKLVLSFKEIQDVLVLNRTNALILASVFGDDTEKWIGQKITLKKVKRNFQGRLLDAIEVEAV